MKVTNEKELERALENREHTIVFEGPQAVKVVEEMEKAQAKKRATRNTAIGAGILCLLAAPFTGGVSLAGLGVTAGVAALSNTVILAIITAVVTISQAAINAIKEYQIEKEKNRVIFTRK